MTLKKAEETSDHVINMLAQKAPTAFCRRSQLRGQSLPEIASALSLVIAKRRQIAGLDSTMRSECRDFAQKANALLWSLHMVIIGDEDADELAQLQKDTVEFKHRLISAMTHRHEVDAEEWNRILALETLDSFDSYCWTLDAFDPLYWQQVYTHLKLSYDESSPRGNPEFVQDEHGNLNWDVITNAARRGMTPAKAVAWTLFAILLIWLTFKWNR